MPESRMGKLQLNIKAFVEIYGCEASGRCFSGQFMCVVLLGGPLDSE